MSSPSHIESEWLRKLAQGDEVAFTEIYHQYWKLLFSVAANKLDNLTDAEEVVQEVFADLWKRRAEINIQQSLKSYLAAAVKFQVYSLLHKKYRQRLHEQDMQAPASISVHVEEQYDLKELQQQLNQTVAQLPERCKLIYELSREKGLSHKEIAQTLDIAEKTVENQLTKALKHLRTSLKSFFSFLY
ncbi:RNA polymerase sigma-70 factor [Paraflavitalea soli]|uniref:RNA polymerase sigma-70 factor n=1 Tax=Paraflavitalea soli TaxID=2315862 RepID=A0A3B7MRB1_9BACT|nr:RNA polymerase sigma-70 factor [Paraflavitalea soli]AXY75506.1 RNA polymerase sigma-70 factor [Paraflavitalea soli]